MSIQSKFSRTVIIRSAAIFAVIWALVGVSAAFAESVSLAEHESAIAELRREVKELKHESDIPDDAPRGWAARLSLGALVFAGGMLLFLALRIGIRKFENAISEKNAIRESAQTLRLKTITKIFHWTGSIFLVLAVAYMVLDVFGINIAPLLAGAGIVGLAFGFGGQYLIRDLINGVFILIEGQYGVNDVVKIGEYGGLVEDVNLRTTTLRDLEGRVIIIPNGEIKTVINMTKDYARAVVDVSVAYHEDVDRVIDVLKDIGRQLREDPVFGRLILEDLETLGVESLADSQVVIRVRLKTLPIKQWDVAREMRRRVKKRFDELGIEIPFPHRTLYWGKGQTPA